MLVNIFGGIAKCDMIAEALVKAGREVGFKVPVVVRLEGTNVEKARQILDGVRGELPMIQTATGLTEAAQEGGGGGEVGLAAGRRPARDGETPMATVNLKLMTPNEFFDWANRPENQGRFWELDEGDVVEMPPPGEIHGILCTFIAHLLWRYVLERGRGAVAGNDTGLLVKKKPGTVRGPDIMLFDEASLCELSRKFSKRIPRLIVEVLSPSDRMARVNRRVSQYLSAVCQSSGWSIRNREP